MCEELLSIDKLATLEELQFILLEALDLNAPIEWVDLCSICKDRSLNLNRSFDATLRFLELISLVGLDANRRVSRQPSINYETIKGDYAFCTFITKQLSRTLGGQLLAVLNPDVIKFDITHETYSLNTNLMPFEYPLMKLYLLKMDIARPDHTVRSHIIINNIYKQSFKDMVYPILPPSTKLDLHSNDTATHPPSVAKGIKVFISYSHKDEAFKEELTNHLSTMRSNGIILDWNDRMILPGQVWDAAIKKALEEADIVLFLISADFLASDYINRVEIRLALARHEQGLTTLIPILVRHCDFANSSLCHLQALPKDAQPITSWADRDQAFMNIVTGLKKIIGKL